MAVTATQLLGTLALAAAAAAAAAPPVTPPPLATPPPAAATAFLTQVASVQFPTFSYLTVKFLTFI